jgi:hypothetical protein
LKIIGSRKVQPRKRVSGKNPAMRYYGYANNLMTILEERNPKLWIDKISKSPEPGVIVNCTITRNFDFKVTNRIIDIIFEDDVKDDDAKYFKCFCNCNFSNGYVVEVNETEDPLITYYTVLGCKKKNNYRIYINILANDFTLYEEGQHILLMSYNEFDYNCCRTQINAVGCSAIESEEDVGSEDWRTTYRILAVCPKGLLRWYDEVR